jgi:hypothetical protein
MGSSQPRGRVHDVASNILKQARVAKLVELVEPKGLNVKVLRVFGRASSATLPIFSIGASSYCMVNRPAWTISPVP